MRKVAIITGGNRGIGKAIAKELAKEGLDIVINSTNQEDASNTAKELENSFGIKSIGIAADVKNKFSSKKSNSQNYSRIQSNRYLS